MKMPDSSVVCKIAGRSEATLQGFPEAPRTMMNCMICAVNERLSFGNFLAYQVMRAPGITPTLVGLLVLCCFTIIKLAFVFYLVDTVFRFTMMIVLLPLLIMGYAFPQTKGERHGVKNHAQFGRLYDGNFNYDCNGIDGRLCKFERIIRLLNPDRILRLSSANLTGRSWRLC